MSNLFITLFAYLIDKKFGEFDFIKHPVIYIGDLITFFEDRFYGDTLLRGLFLVAFVLIVVESLASAVSTLISYLPFMLDTILTSLIASIFIAHRMLRESVSAILSAEDKKEAVSMLVSRDTKDMSESDIYRAAIESYAENLSDGVIAPLFYLLLFNLPGVVIYKAVNTMDSMVGYRNKRYENYGKVAAILDDILNFIPSRLTAMLIMLLSDQKDIFAFYEDGKKHDSPNAGHPITAMALSIGVKLGGDTSYFGKIKHKAYFGKGRSDIKSEDVTRALAIF